MQRDRGAPTAVLRTGTAVLALAVLVAGAPGPAVVPLAVVLALGALAVFLRRAVPGPDRRVWVRLQGTAVLLAVGVLVTVLPAAGPLGVVPAMVAVVVGFPTTYGGLLRWNRFSTSAADPNDVLNASAAVLVAVAMGNVVVDLVGGPLTELPEWQLQPMLAAAAVAVIELGTSWVITAVAGLARDVRMALVAGTQVALLVAAGLALWSAGEAVGPVAAVTGAAVVMCSVAAALPARTSTPQPADPADSTVGAFALISVATVTLVVGALTDSRAAIIWCAGLAAVASSLRLLVNLRDLAQLAVSRREALTDELTGLANRRALIRRIEELCATGHPFSLGLVDLDRFKEVNDGLGHAAGDELLRRVSRRLADHLPAGAMVGRLGGDEFAVVVPVPPQGDPGDLTPSLGADLVTLSREPYDVDGLVLHAPVCVGTTGHVADGHAPGDCATRLLRRADAALYDAKRHGATAVTYDATRHVDTSGRITLVEELRAAVDTDQLVLWYQPQVDVASGRTVGVEALVRWQHPTRGLLAPAEFLPLAEAHALMGPVTERVLAEAVRQGAEWRRTGTPLRVSVNLSASNLSDTALPARVAALLAEHGLPASALVLEVTETVLMTEPDAGLVVVRALAELGAAISIDDFGTGWSSLTYLKDLPVTELKLDRSFTADLLTEPRTAAIVHGTIELAHRLGLRVVAEGVETAATLAHLARLDCDESQGYLHSRPVPAPAVTALLAVATTAPPVRQPA
ncbi:putative bifunctional diguanylate cyclase/phosphodiesterase [Modestobacter roseus]|uniref:Diguanylate cyclase (GGDEF)-like protein n=1 Tax=Modestobacter roseus TaxID=1181884 RepID=A0A562ILW9_9ACTN|nr:bifunctional diguanylate cyclase/phosphodiesterase [Modestobacter roseus]MQA34291.1 EAL domain-containing protein [Modestobacter roseus]TWH71872.1 diguanylate cyclase (GGDEF)-like protein [Modestobacter roseus]